MFLASPNFVCFKGRYSGFTTLARWRLPSEPSLKVYLHIYYCRFLHHVAHNFVTTETALASVFVVAKAVRDVMSGRIETSSVPTIGKRLGSELKIDSSK